MSEDLGFDLAQAVDWFPHDQETPYVLVRVSDAHTKDWAKTLGIVVRRCYVNDSVVNDRAKALGVAKAEIIAARMPDPGSTMAGDFGEILVYLYQGSKELPATLIGPKKWRLKQDRTKPAPYSDVVHFHLPAWPCSTPDDIIFCSEVKTKSTNADSKPIPNAIVDSKKDRTSRLGRTLVWLRERALLEPLGDVQITHLERFIKAANHPPASKRFRAVAVICQSLVDEELKTAPTTSDHEYTLVVIAVPNLQETYSEVFHAATQTVPDDPADGAAAPAVRVIVMK